MSSTTTPTRTPKEKTRKTKAAKQQRTRGNTHQDTEGTSPLPPMWINPRSSGPQARRSPMMVIAGVVLVIVGALVSVGIYTQLSQTQEVIAIVTPVARGQQIHRTDLITVQVGFDALLKPVPASQINQVVGQYATADLVPGSFLVTDAVGDRPSPALGEAEIGVALIPGEYPNTGLIPGDKVLLVAVPEYSETWTTPMSYPGTLVMIADQNNSMAVATVRVSAANAPTLAVLAASNRIALVLTTREN